MHDRYFSDEELVAYLDGEVDFAPIAAIDAARRQDAALQKRIDALEIDRAALAAAFDGLAPRTPTLPFAPPAAPPRRGLWAGITATATAAALAIGFMAGSARQAPLTQWTDYVAAYQALYSSSTLAHIARTETDQQAELDRVAAAIGKSIPVGALTLFPDVQYTRAQILSFEGQSLIQLAFLTGAGAPVALCIIRAEEAPNTSPAFQQMEGLSTALWAQNGYEYILIGGQDDALIERMASGFVGMEI